MTTNGRKDSLPEPELDEYGIPVRARSPRRWITWVLQIACLAAGIWSAWLAIPAAHSEAGARWHTHHWGIEAPAWGVIALTVGTAIWKGRQKDKGRETGGKLGWWVLAAAFAAAIISIWALSLVQPYQEVGG